MLWLNKSLVSVYCTLPASHTNFAEMHPLLQKAYWIQVRRREVSFHLKTNRWRLKPILTLPADSTHVFLRWLSCWACADWGRPCNFLFSSWFNSSLHCLCWRMILLGKNSLRDTLRHLKPVLKDERCFLQRDECGSWMQKKSSDLSQPQCSSTSLQC